ncbi:MAG: NfeD family protein, partial [Actinomyces dentalis]
MAWLWWIGAALVLGVIETLTVDLTFLMFAGGAVGGAIAAALGASFLVQVIVFAVVSTLLLAAVRPWAKWQLLSTTPDMRTNASALIGREATALTVIDERGGRVRLGGEEW